MIKNMRNSRLPRWNVLLIWAFLLSGLGNLQPARAAIYKYRENGVVHYSNQPPEHLAYKIVGEKTPGKLVRTLKTSKKTSKTRSRSKTPRYAGIIQRVASAYDLSPELVKAVVKVESNYNHKAVSPKGAKGLMQLMPATAKRFGVEDTFDPEQNITGGVKYLHYLFNEFGDENLDLVLAGYNAGEHAVRKYGNKVPPYKETQQYVKKVKALCQDRSFSAFARTKKIPSIYKYVDKHGVLAFTNVPRVN